MLEVAVVVVVVKEPPELLALQGPVDGDHPEEVILSLVKPNKLLKKKPIFTLMHLYSILNSNNNSSIIIPSKIKRPQTTDQVIVFYAPDYRLHPKMEKLYLYSSGEKVDQADFLSWSGEESGLNLVGSFYVFPSRQPGFNLAELHVNQHSTNIGLTIQWGSGGMLNFWVFPDKNHTKLYTLAAMVWPPAQKYADEIVELLDNHYEIVENYDILVPKPKLLGFVRKIYRGDKRCDKSQLPWKCQQMLPYYPKIRYIKFLVKELDLDYMRVSQTAVMIKDIIRRQFKNRINNYVHDIIFHISDNQSHARSMETVIKKMKRI